MKYQFSVYIQEEEELNARQKAFDEAPPDSRPSTGMSDVLMADDIDLEEEQLEEIEAHIYGGVDDEDNYQEGDGFEEGEGPSRSRLAWQEEMQRKEAEKTQQV